MLPPFIIYNVFFWFYSIISCGLLIFFLKNEALYFELTHFFVILQYS